MMVIGTAGTEKGLVLAGAQGAHHVADHRTPDYEKQIVAFTGGRGVDVIAEMVANVNLAKDLTLLAPSGGRIVVVGNRGSIEINPRDAMMREATILGMTMWGATPADITEIHSAIYAGLEKGTLRPVIGHELPLSEGPRSHQQVLEPGAYGKIVLIP
jgi:NADPH2:quinone reductase